MFSLLKTLSPAPFVSEIQDKELVDKKYKYWRIRTVYSLFLGYTFFYFTRKSYTFAMPLMSEELGYDARSLGFLSTVLYVTYAFSKFFSGITSDRSNPRYFMSIGLILTGIFNLAFGFSNHIVMFALFIGLNGWFQGWGWPPITKQLTHWYSKSERGTWWSVCGISHNVGGAIIPILALYAAQLYGWQYAMFVPGILCIIMGFFLMNRLRDIPQTLGLPPIDKYKNDYEVVDSSNNESRVLTPKQILFEQVLINKYVWLLAIAYFYVYVVRTAINDWTVLYLMEEKSYTQIAAGISIAWFEIGGLLGMLIAGWGTDKFLGGRRTSFMIVCSILMIFAVSALYYLPPIHIYIDYIIMGIIGFLVFGPQMLVGIVAAEAVDKKAACTANGFVGCWAYIGAAATGYPLGVLIKNSWEHYFIALIISCVILSFILIYLSFYMNKSKNRDLSQDNNITDESLATSN